MNNKVIKILSIGVTIASTAVSIASSMLDDKKMELEVQNRVNKAVADAIGNLNKES